MRSYQRLWVLLIACAFCSSIVRAQILTGTSVSIGAGLNEMTLTRFDDSDGTLLVLKVKNEAMPLSDQGAAIDRLLDQSIKQRSLPDHFDVRFAGTRTALIKALQQRLLQPGANWNLTTGQPSKGELGSVLSTELTRLLTQSSIGTAFARHGYRLRVDGLEHIEEEPGAFPRAGVRVPTDIFVMEIVAERNTEQ